MDDAALVAAARTGDQEAWGTIYDRYADRLHDHCWSILRDEHEAADALHDAFVNAARALPQLRDPSRLRPWLYAIARNEAYRRHRQRRRAVPSGDLGADLGTDDPELGTVTVDLDEHDGAPVDDLRRLVWDAAGGLTPEDQALLDLHLRQGLEGEELAEALGTTTNNTYVRMSRLRDTLERSLGALLVARTGRQDCPELAQILAGWDGDLTPLLRKRVARHVDGCEQCGERRKAMVSPLALFAGMPMLPAPDGLRARIISDASAAAAAVPLGPDEQFPVPAPVPVPPPPADGNGDGGGRGAPWGPILATVAAMIVVVLLALLLTDGDDGDVATDDTTTSSTSTSSTTSSTSSTTTSSTSTTSTSSTSTTAPPTPASVGLSTTSIDFGASSTSQEVTITNSGGSPMPYTLTTDASTAVLQLNRSGGTLQPGASHTLIVTLDRAAAPEGDLSANIRVNAGAAGQPVIGVTAEIAPDAPELGTVTLTPPDLYAAGPDCPDTTFRVPVSDESDIARAEVRWVGASSGDAGSQVLDVVNGAISGTLFRPTQAEAVTFTFRVTDEHGATGQRELTITARRSSPPTACP